MYCSKCGANVADNTAFCAACGQPVAAAGGVAAPPVGVSAAPAPQAAALPGVLYAGFWLRVVAAIIDYIILGIPLGVIFFLLIAGSIPALVRMQGQDPFAVMMLILPRFLLIAVISLAASWLYWALLESSEWQATLGKKALGLYVTDMAGRRATFSRTSGRFFAGRGISVVPYLGGLYFLISCIMAGLTEKKQALHDMIANCLVLRKA
jgi:uncharacterized RDD family membrane protein YckC